MSRFFFVVFSCQKKLIFLDNFRATQIKKRNKTALQFWRTEGNLWPSIQNMALPLFYLTTSSAACERNFSSLGFIHNKLRSRLAHDKINKLLFVRANHLHEQTMEEWARDSSEESSDEKAPDSDSNI